MTPIQKSDAPVHSGTDLEAMYKARFKDQEIYRRRVWAVLTKYFGRWIPSDGAVLDLGCGYCEFINQARCAASQSGPKKNAPQANPSLIRTGSASDFKSAL